MHRLVAIALAVLLSCTVVVSAQTSALIPITVAPIASGDQVSLFYALQQGWFKNAGLDVTLQQAPSGSVAMTTVASGAAQIGYSNPFSLILAYSRGIPIELVAAGGQYDSSNPHAKLLVAANSPIVTAKDLEGHVLAVTGLHDMLALAVSAWMAAAGADATKVRIVEMPGSAMLAALQAQRVDAVMIYEPFMSSAEASSSLRTLAKPLDAISPLFAAGAWFAMGPWAKTHRDAIARFARVMSQAGVYANGHYDELIPMVSGYSKMPVDTLKKMVQIKIMPSLTAASIQPIIDIAARYHEIPTVFRARDMMAAP